MADLVGTFSHYGEQDGSVTEADLTAIYIQPLHGETFIVTDITIATEGESWVYLSVSTDNGTTWEHRYSIHVPSAGSLIGTLKQPIPIRGAVDDDGIQQVLVKLTYIQTAAVKISGTIHGHTTGANFKVFA